MTEPRKKYDSTVARIAGNILSGRTPNLATTLTMDDCYAVVWAVSLARAIIMEVEDGEERGRSRILNENEEASQAGDK
jgi:hypothetical protein